MTPGFGDTVRIRDTELTQSLGLAGRAGRVFGETTPSISRVDVIGPATDDFALNVMVDERGEQLWFAPELVELVDHSPGLEVTIGNRRLIRTPTGGWSEVRGIRRSLRQGFIDWLLRPFRPR